MSMDRRIAALERQVLILSGQIAARDVAMKELLREVFTVQADTASSLIEQYPQMVAEIDTKVLSSITQADQQVIS